MFIQFKACKAIYKSDTQALKPTIVEYSLLLGKSRFIKVWNVLVDHRLAVPFGPMQTAQL